MVSNQCIVNLNIGDKVTTISCSHIIAELIKFLAYQRLQIPYSYQWLKQIVNKKKEKLDQGVKDSFQSERHFRIVSTALQNLDFILKSLLQEISSAFMPEEICITFGSTLVTCKEIFRFILPLSCHKPQCHSEHILKDAKLQSNVFKTLVTSQELSTLFSNPLPPTNMHVFIKKRMSSCHNAILIGDHFIPANGSKIPKNCKIYIINLRSINEDSVSCCNRFEIFSETIAKDLANLKLERDHSQFSELNEIQSTKDVKWFQSSYVMKGFKDCIVNGNSITNQWLN